MYYLLHEAVKRDACEMLCFLSLSASVLRVVSFCHQRSAIKVSISHTESPRSVCCFLEALMRSRSSEEDVFARFRVKVREKSRRGVTVV